MITTAMSESERNKKVAVHGLFQEEKNLEFS
jgi:hypothetical protein